MIDQVLNAPPTRACLFALAAIALVGCVDPDVNASGFDIRRKITVYSKPTGAVIQEVSGYCEIEDQLWRLPAHLVVTCRRVYGDTQAPGNAYFDRHVFLLNRNIAYMYSNISMSADQLAPPTIANGWTP